MPASTDSSAGPAIGVFGGSGFYRFLGDVEMVAVDTPYGPPSDRIALGEVAGRRVAFLPRHGSAHTLPPAAINYRANLWALKEVGVTQILAPTAAGSLQPEIEPGDFVLCDQFVDRTWGRADTFYPQGPRVAHLAAADPYCPQLRQLTAACAAELEIKVHERGTVVVIQGPRFSTRAESRWYSAAGWEVINMTQYPEVVLARELGLCYTNIALITDFDAGLEGDPSVAPVSAAEVKEVFARNNDRLRALLIHLIPRVPVDRTCPCASAAQEMFLAGP